MPQQQPTTEAVLSLGTPDLDPPSFGFHLQYLAVEEGIEETETTSGWSLLYDEDTSLAVRKLFGMHLFLGGLSHKERHAAAMH